MKEKQYYYEKLLRQALDDFFYEKGFEYERAWNQYRKMLPCGFACYILSISPYEEDCIVEMHVGIRHDNVEKIAFHYTKGLRDFSDNSMTLVTSMGKIMGKNYFRYAIKDAASLKNVVKDMMQQVDIHGMKFLDSVKDLTYLNELYNAAPLVKNPFLHNEINRAMRGIAIAKLTHHTDLEALVAVYRHHLRGLEIPSPTLQRFDKMCDFLLTYSMN